MRKILFTLMALGALGFSGQQAMAHGYGHRGYYRGGYPQYAWRGGYGPYVGGYYGAYPAYGPGYVGGYGGYGYAAAYPGYYRISGARLGHWHAQLFTVRATLTAR